MAEVKQQKARVLTIAEKETEDAIKQTREHHPFPEELIRIPYYQYSVDHRYEAFTLYITEFIPQLLKRKGMKPYYFRIDQNLEGERAFFSIHAENEEDFMNSIYNNRWLRNPYEVFEKHSNIHYIEVTGFY